ncbi:T9SS type B sorting domain-containing protein, partial [bacterium]|nr:T9SS type B sorting domain-containing protein [bacterium]
DSVYLYDSDVPGVNLIGGFTGNNLPNSGQPIKLESGHLTIIHFSDPLVVDKGFKARLRTYRSDLSLQPIPDTLVCYKQELTFNAIASGGYREQYYYLWDGVKGDSSYTYRPETTHKLVLELGDACTKRFVRDTVLVDVRDPLQIDSFGDLEFCFLEEVELVASASGGLPSNYSFNWSWNSVSGDTLKTQFEKDTSISIYLNDGCSATGDTLQIKVKVRAPISLNYVSTDTVCQGADAMFMVQGKGGIDSFLFITESDDTFGWNEQYLRVISPESVGDYHYYVAVTDLCSGINDTAFLNLHVRDSLRLSISRDTMICNGTEANLRAEGSGGKPSWYEYKWTPGSIAGNEIDVQPLASQWYHVALNDACSSFEPRDSIYVKVLAAIEVNILGPDTSCYGEMLEFSSEVTGGDSTSYIYDWKDLSSSDSNLINRFYSSRELVLEVWDNCSDKPGLDTFLLVNRPALDLQILADSSICKGQELWLETISSGGVKENYELSWTAGLGTGASKWITIESDTLIKVQLNDACSETASDSIRIKALKLPELQIGISDNPTCTSLPVYFNSLGNNSGTSDYLWEIANETFAVKDPEMSFDIAGTYSVHLKILNEFGCVDSLELIDTLEVLEFPVADFDFSPDSAAFTDATFTFTNNSQFSSSYLWDFDGLSSSTAENPSLFLNRVGDYRIILFAQNEAGCVDTAQKWLSVYDAFTLYVPNAFSPNGDHLNDGFRPILSGMEEYEIMIYNRLGQVLFRSEDPNSSWDGTYRGELVQDGHYFVYIRGIDLHGNPVEHKSIVLVLR